MARKFKLRPISSEDDVIHERSGAIDRREFMRLSFNTAAGLITTASLGSVGFASFLMGQAEGGSSDSSIKFYVPKGSDVWYSNMDKQPMTLQSFVDESANTTTGMVGSCRALVRLTHHSHIRPTRGKQKQAIRSRHP